MRFKHDNKKKLFIVVAIFVLLICSYGFAEVRKINETVNSPGKKFMLSGAFDVSYEFHLDEGVGITELKIFAYDSALRQSPGAIARNRYSVITYPNP